MQVPTLYDWFSSSASTYNLVSLDRKRSQNAVFTRSLSPTLLITTTTPSLVKTSIESKSGSSVFFKRGVVMVEEGGGGS